MMNTQDEIRRIESRPHKVTIEGRERITKLQEEQLRQKAMLSIYRDKPTVDASGRSYQLARPDFYLSGDAK